MHTFVKWLVLAGLLILVVNSTTLASEQEAEWISLQSTAVNEAIPQLTAVNHNPLQTDLDFELPGLWLNRVNEGGTEFQVVQFPLAGSTNEIGKPDLPLFSKFVAIPPGSDVSIEITYSETEIFRNIDLHPVQNPLREGETRTDFVMDQGFYSSFDGLYPAKIADIGQPVIMRDFRLAPVVIQPVQYNPVSKEMLVHHNIQVRVNYSGTNLTNAKQTATTKISAGWDPIYRATIANYDQVRDDLDIEYGSYMIIAPNNNAALPYLEEFAEWKHRKGWHTRIVQLEEIGTNPSSYQIRSYISAAYYNWEYPPEYVLLVGDEDNNPFGKMPDYSYNGYTSDHQYSTLEGNDYLADLFVGRASVDNLTELDAFLTKVVTYEQDPYMDDGGAWLKKALMTACAGCGGPDVVTPVLTCNWVRDKLFEHGYTQVDTLYDGWYGGHPTSAQISSSINEGKGIVNYRGVAGPGGWSAPYYGVWDINSLQNDWYNGIMTSIVCGTGEFGSWTDPCFGEAWIRAGSATVPKGGVCFGGASDTDTHTRWNNPITTGFYYGLFEEDLRTFGQGWVRGKLNQYFGFPNNNQTGGTVNQYHNTYNVLGDPALHIYTDVPGTFDTVYDSQISFGQNSFNLSVSSGGSPVEGALVCLWKAAGDEDDVFELAHTDANGQAILMIDPASSGEMKMTITAHNYIPHLDEIAIVQTAYSVGVQDWSTDGDGQIEPGDTIELTVTMKNFGSSSVSNVQATVNSLTEWAEMEQAQLSFGNITPGQTADASFSFTVPSYAMNGDKIHFSFDISDDQSHNWPGVILESVKAYQLTVDEITSSNVNPGSTGNVIFRLLNVGSLAAQNVAVTLTSSSSLVTVVNASSSFGTIQPGDDQTNSNNPFSISVSPEVINGMQFNMMLTATDASGYSHDFYYPIQIGHLNSNAIVGPDEYGYYAFDNSDPEMVGTTFEWIELHNGSGIEIPGMGDDNTETIDLPFNFQYYGETFDQISVCSNGWFSFGITGMYNFRNWQIPNGIGPDGQVMVFWDDLSVSGSSRGVYYWYDAANHSFVIEWYNASCQWGGSGSNTFEVILLDPDHYQTPTGDGEIIMQYEQVHNSDYYNNYATVGIESVDQSDGIQYHYADTASPGAMDINQGLAVKFTTSAPINAVSTVSGTVLLDDSNDPATMTRVHLWQNFDYELIPKGVAVVEADGSFVFDNVYSITGFGEYYISVRLIDLYSPTLEWYDDSPNYEGATPLQINNGDDVTDIGIQVTIPILPDISGTVTDENSGNPLQAAIITVWRSSDTGNPIFFKSIETGTNGEYSFENGSMDHLQAGVYYISVRLAGDSQEAEWYDNVNQFSEATPITIDYDQAADNIDFGLMLGAAGGISGLVTDDEDNPLAAMRVVAWRNVGGEPDFVDYGLTDSNGVFYIGGTSWNYLETGTYYVSLTTPDQGLYPLNWYDGGNSFETATPINVNEDAVTTDIDLIESSPLTGTISGAVTWDDDGGSVENAEVMVMIQGHYAYWQGAITDENGDYSIQCPPSAEAIVYVAHPYFGGIVEFNGDADSPDQATPVIVEADQTTTVDFGLADYTENAYISGTISSTGGITNFGTVQLFHVNDRDKPAKSFFIGSGQQVQFNKFIKPGSYTMMTAGLSADGIGTLQFYSNTYNLLAATRVDLEANDFFADIDFTLNYSEMRTISGNAANADGPVEKAQILAVNYFNHNDIWVAGTSTDDDGNYVLNVPDGIYYIMALGLNGVPMFYNSEINWTLAPAVTDGANNVDFMLPITADAHGTSISGTITIDGDPLPYVRVYAFDDFGPAAYAVTDTDGNYTLYGLQPEIRYSIQANRFGYFHGIYVEKIMLNPWQALSGVDLELVVSDLEPLEIENDDGEDQTSGSAGFALFQNYPNPFNPSTTISFQLPEPDRVTIDIFNVAGQRVKRLVDTNYDAGPHQLQWKGSNELGLSVG
ncbi:MAG: hypothetical protein GY869_22160, partial [Planctomycetes bacterium]|nr:hypothetical protein [Planctomycetota bacterium]